VAQPSPGSVTSTGSDPRRRNLYIFGTMTAALLVSAALVIWSLVSKEDPRLNADTVTLVRFITSDRYLGLPLEKQGPYMEVIETREDNGEIRELFETGRISESEYRAALLEAWLGEQLKRSTRYAGLPAGSTRQEYVRDLLDKKQKRKKEKDTSAKSGGGGKAGLASKIKRDGAAEEIRIAAWPAEARRRWEDFRKAYDAEKDARAGAEAGAAGEGARAEGRPTPE
jgi:hypothetical protein